MCQVLCRLWTRPRSILPSYSDCPCFDVTGVSYTTIYPRNHFSRLHALSLFSNRYFESPWNRRLIHGLGCRLQLSVLNCVRNSRATGPKQSQEWDFFSVCQPSSPTFSDTYSPHRNSACVHHSEVFGCEDSCRLSLCYQISGSRL